MNEVEVKFLDINVQEIIKKLEKLGAKKGFEGDVVPLFFDFPGDTLKKKDQILRLRKKGDHTELAFKQKKEFEGAKVAEEIELKVAEFETMRKILLLIGLKEVARKKKHRIGYYTDHAHFEIDTYDGLPTYLEVEAESFEDLKKAVKSLGLDMKDAKPWSGRQLLEYYGKE